MVYPHFYLPPHLPFRIFAAVRHWSVKFFISLLYHMIENDNVTLSVTFFFSSIRTIH